MANEVRIEDLAQMIAIKDNDLTIVVDSAETASEETAKRATVSQLKNYFTSEINSNLNKKADKDDIPAITILGQSNY